MNAYAMYDSIEEFRWVRQQLQDERDAWIDNRAQEIIALFPDWPVFASSPMLPAVVHFALQGECATEAYNEMVSVAAYERAKLEWEYIATCPF